jgi:hypothetical protein
LVANSSIMAGSARTSASAIAVPRIRFLPPAKPQR